MDNDVVGSGVPQMLNNRSLEPMSRYDDYVVTDKDLLEQDAHFLEEKRYQ